MKQGFLVREVQVNGTFTDACPSRDIFHPGRGKAPFKEQVKGGRRQLGGGHFAAGAAWGKGR